MTSMLELDPGARLETVTIEYPNQLKVTPDARSRPPLTRMRPTASRLGFPWTEPAWWKSLRRMGHRVADSGKTRAFGRRKCRSLSQ